MQHQVLVVVGPPGPTGPAGGNALYGPIASRPSAASAGDRALWIASDQSNTIYQVQGGAWVTIGGGGGSSASNASDTVIGIAKLSVAPASSVNPIAVGDNDARNSNARTPTSHASSHQPGGSDALAVDAASGTGSLRTLGTGAQQAASGTDSRLSDARTPTAHESSHLAGGSDALPWTTIHGKGLHSARPAAASSNGGYFYYETDTTDLFYSDGSAWTQIARGVSDAVASSLLTGNVPGSWLGATSTTAAAGNDSRLSDARTPTTHATTHQPGGSDALAVDAAAGTGSLRTLGTGAQQATSGTDSRLSDARTPTLHASTHQPGGSDAMAVDAVAGTGSLRTLGTGAQQAAAGNDGRITGALQSGATAGGDLAGTLPSPTLDLTKAHVWTGIQSGPMRDVGGAYFNVTASTYGAVADLNTRSDAVMTSGSAILTSATGTFGSSGEVGKIIRVAGAGAAGATLTSTIISRQSTTQVTLNDAASTSVGGNLYSYGTDNTAAFNAAIVAATAAKNGTVIVPAGSYGLKSLTNITASVNMIGVGHGATLLVPMADADIISVNVGGSTKRNNFLFRDFSFFTPFNVTAGACLHLGNLGAVQVRNVKIVNSGSNRPYEGIRCDEVRDCVLDVSVTGTASHGIILDLTADATVRSIGEIVIPNTAYISSCQGSGLYMRNNSTTANSTVDGIHIEARFFANVGDAITSYSQAGLIRDVHVQRAHLDSSSGSGFATTGTARQEQIRFSDVWTANNSVCGISLTACVVDYEIDGGTAIVNGHEGVLVDASARGSIDALKVWNNSQSAAATYYGIRVQNSAADVKVRGNYVYNTGKNSYLNQLGIYVDSSTTGWTVADNECDVSVVSPSFNPTTAQRLTVPASGGWAFNNRTDKTVALAIPSTWLGSTSTTAAVGNDSRLSDARTPLAHETTHLAGGSDALPWTTIHGKGLHSARPAAASTNAGYVYYETDTTDLFLSDGSAWTQIARGVSDSVASSLLTGTIPATWLGATSTTAAAGNDTRLSDARTPTAHASTHQPGGSDAMAVDAVAGTGSLRTLGTGSAQAAPGNDSRFANPSWAVAVKTTGPYTIAATDAIVIANAAGLTFHLPSAAAAVTAGATRVYVVKNGASGTGTTIDSPTAGTIDGAASYTGLSVAYQAVTIFSDGSNWFLM